MRYALLLACAALLAACSSTDAPELPRFLRGDSAGTAAGGAQPAAESAAAQQVADGLFARAKGLENPAERANLYGDIADDHPGHPRAAEARYLEGRSYYEAGDWDACIEALKQYMTDSPVNPHLGQVEEMIYRSGLQYLQQDRGVLDIFSDDGTGLEALRFVPVVFPAGKYADDSILYLARHFRDEGELQRASLYYKELLQRYPDSEWSFEARRELGGTYAKRDVGEVYHAGFVDRDPREAVNSEDPKAAAHAGPVRSSLEMALTEYDKYLERIARDPGRRQEYAQRVREVEAEKARVRAQLAAKDERVAAWYAGQGDARAAEVYRRSAARWRGATNTSVLPNVKPPVVALPSATDAVPAPRVPVPAIPSPAVASPTVPTPAMPTPAMPTPTMPTPLPARPPQPTTVPRPPTSIPTPSVRVAPPQPPPPSSLPTVRVPSVRAPTAPAGVRVPPPPPPPAWPASR